LTTLYGAWFGLQREPFSIAPDPRTLFMSERHREALAHLLNGATINLAFWAAEGEASEGRRERAHATLAAVFNGLTRAR
jgi:general secretion pathway protein A